MSTTAHLFALAQQQCQAGNFVLAEQLCRQILLADPSHADAWCLLATACVRQEKYDEAIANYQKGLRLNPHIFAGHYLLGILLDGMGRLDEAENHFRQALRQIPDHVDVQQVLGQTLMKQGRAHDAIACFRQILKTNPNLGDVWFNLGQALAQQENIDEAIECYVRTIQLQPNSAPAYIKTGMALERQNKPDAAILCFQQAIQFAPNDPEGFSRLGRLLDCHGNSDAAVQHYEQALRLAPNDSQVWNHLGCVLLKQGQFDNALRCFEEALRLKPTFSLAHFNLGVVYSKRRQHVLAISQYRQALLGEHAYEDAHVNLGSALVYEGQFAEAEVHYRKALQLKPEDGDAHWNLAQVCLRLGRYEEGWREYEWRNARPGFSKRVFAQPLWNGSDLAGRTILVYCEQGLGDALQFIRYISLVKERGGRVIVECKPQLVRLLQCVKGIDCLVAEGEPLPLIDVHSPLLTLPYIFGTTLATIPLTIPYLYADKALEEHWRRLLEAVTKFKIGIVWQGNPLLMADPTRSIPLARFAPLAKIEGVQLINLQKGHGKDQLQDQAAHIEVMDLGEQFDEAAGAFMDSAAVMKNLDLMICSDTSIPHLAGALGVPVWVALAKVPDWRWMLEREDCPWYPTMRLFRQQRAGDWHEVFERIAGEVTTRILSGRPALGICSG